VFFQLLGLWPRKSFKDWVLDSREAVLAYCFLIAMYAAQCALYRSLFPVNLRYDFPAMLLVPFTCCILAGEISRQARAHFPERTIDYAQLTAAGFLFFALVFFHQGKPPALVAAVQTNIRVTNAFYDELQRIVRAAKDAPENPIILDAYGPGSYEPVFSLSSYLPALGVKNRISVRFHRDEKAGGTLYDNLQRTLSDLQNVTTGAFKPLPETLARPSPGCLSVGIEGPPDAACAGFRIEPGFTG
jgi:hypothetical protein